MLIKEIVGSESQHDLQGFEIDTLHLEWYELNKRIQRKKTTSGREIALKFTSESVALKEGDLLYYNQDEKVAISVRVINTTTIVISPTNMLEMATICYEIGNKHMPLFIDNDDILLPYEAPMFKWLEAAGYAPKQQERKLQQRLKSNVSSHHHEGAEPHHESLFTKVINLAAKRS
ncbi:MAG: urease accessory protein UreE [Rikenellaceae bacterium]